MTQLGEQQEQVKTKLSESTIDEIYKACAQLSLRHPDALPGEEEDRNTYIVMLLETVAMKGYNDALRAASVIVEKYKSKPITVSVQVNGHA